MNTRSQSRRRLVTALSVVLFVLAVSVSINPVHAVASVTSITVGAQSPPSLLTGSSASYPISSTWSGTGGQAATLSVTNWTPTTPAGVSLTFGTNPISKSSPTSTLTIDTTASTPPGTYTFAVVASGRRTGTQSGTGTLTVSSTETLTASNAETLTVSTTAACVVPPSGLVSWWPGDENPNDMANSNNGVWQGSPVYAFGEVAEAFSFSGSNYVQVPDNDLWTLGSSDFTIDLWANFNQVTGTDPFVAHDEGGGSLNKWIFWYSSTTGLTFHFNSPTLGSGVDASYPGWVPNTGTWYHFTVTRSGSTFTLYINGIQVSTPTVSTFVPDAAAPLTIGRAESFYFNGLIDEVEIFNRALSSTEIQDIYNAGSAGKCFPITFDQVGVGSDVGGSLVLTVDGTDNYGVSGLPVSYWWGRDSVHSFAFTSPVVAATDAKQYVWTSTSGLSTLQSDTAFTVTASGTITGNYKTQYYLTVTVDGSSSNPSANASPVSGWFDSGTSITASVTSPVSGGTGIQYVCTGWTGTGSVTSGSGKTTTFTITAPSSIDWHYKGQYLVHYVSSGCSLSVTVPSDEWVDNGAAATGTFPSTVTDTGTRCLFQSDDRPGSITQPTTVTGTYNTQYLLTVKTSGLPSPYGTAVYVGGWTPVTDDYGVSTINDASSNGWRKWFSSGTGTIGVASPVDGATNTRYAFNGWSDASTANPHAGLTLTGPLTLTANYLAQYRHTITSSPVTGAGFITVDGTAQTTPYTTDWWNSGSSHTIAALSPVSDPVSTGTRYVWSSWSDGGAQSHSVSPTSLTTFTANYKTQYYLTVTVDGSSSNPSANASPVSGWFDSDTSITASVTSPVAGSPGYQYVCTGWTGTGSVPASGTTNSATFTITAPSSIDWHYKGQYLVHYVSSGCSLSVTVPSDEWVDNGAAATGTFPSTVTDTGTRCNFVSDDRPGVPPGVTGPITVTGSYQTQYLLTVKTSGLPSPYGTAVYVGGTATTDDYGVSTINDDSSDGWRKWFDANAPTGTIGVASPVDGATNTRYAYLNWDDATTANPHAGLTMTGPLTLTANYLTQYTHTITSSPVTGNGFIKVDGTARATPYTTDWWNSGSSHTIEARSPRSGGTGVQYVWDSWSDGGAQSHSISPTSPTTFTANYKTQYYLTVTVDGSSSNPSANASPVSGWFDSGTSITASVTSPVSGGTGIQYVCTGWTGTGSVPASGTSNSATFTITAPSSIDWHYKGQVYLTVTSAHDSPNPVSGWFDSGTSVTASVTSPDVSGGTRYVCTGWTGTGNVPASGTGTTTTFTITAPSSITWNWNTQYKITFGHSGVGGDFTGTVVAVGGTNYVVGDLPKSFWWNEGTVRSFTFQSPLVVTANEKQYVWTSTSGGLSTVQSGSITVSGSGSVVGNYKTQYYLTVVSAHDSPNPVSGWFDSGSKTASVTSPDVSGSTRYVCTGWTGTGSVPASGTGTSTTFNLAAPSSITWNWNTQYQIIFDQTGVGSDFTGTVVAVEGTNYGVSGLPHSFWWDAGSMHSFAFQSPLAGTANGYVWTSTSGLSTAQSGSITVSGSGSVVGNYRTCHGYDTGYAACILSAPATPSPAITGSDVTFTLTIQNIGTNSMPSSDTTAEVRIFDPNGLPSGGILVGAPINGFTSGAVVTVPLSYTLSASAPVGTWTYNAYVYYNRNLLDQLTGLSFAVQAPTAPTGPAGTIDTVTGPVGGHVARGKTATFSVAVTNTGGATWPSGKVVIKIYGPSGTLATTLSSTISNVAPGAQTFSLRWTVPVGAPMGTYHYDVFLYSGTTLLDSEVSNAANTFAVP